MWQSANFGGVFSLLAMIFCFLSFTAISSEGVGVSTVADDIDGHVGFAAKGALVQFIFQQ